MKNSFKYILSLLVLSVLFASCKDDYADQPVAKPTINEQGELQSTEGFAFALGGDFAAPIVLSKENLEEKKMLEAVKTTATPQLPEGATMIHKIEISKTETFEEVSLLSSTGKENSAWVAAADLDEALKAFYGKAPFARELYLRVTSILADGEVRAQLAEPTILGPVVATPVGMPIETEYYLIGNLNGWDINNLDDYKFTHSGKDVYEDPIFTILVETMLDNDGNGYFKIVPKSSKDAASWDGVLGNPIDGNTEPKGELTVENGQAMRVTEPGWVKITLNMLEYTYSIEIIGEVNPTLYVPGSHQGWTPATAPTLFSRNFDFKYEGYLYFDNAHAFKFTSQANWGGTNYGDGGEGTLSTDGGAANLEVGEEGYYKINVDLSNLPYTYSMTKTEWGLIGDATPGGWDNSTPMVYDPATGVWSVTASLEAKSFKFRANNGWEINMGGEMNDLSYNGDNIQVEEAGDYLITLDLSDPKAYKATMVKQ